MGAIVRRVQEDRGRLGPELTPESGKLALRVACPTCGIADKHGILNEYDEVNGEIRFYYPAHGMHLVDLGNLDDVARVEFNTPLRNLVRALVYASDESATHIRVTGADYAGQYQEQLLLRQWPHSATYDGDSSRVKRPPIHIYAPLTVDWTGSKLSKSLYVKEGAYEYLREQNLGYLLSLQEIKLQGKDQKVVWDEVERWMAGQKKLFRPYSVEYWHLVFSQAGDSKKKN